MVQSAGLFLIVFAPGGSYGPKFFAQHLSEMPSVLLSVAYSLRQY